MTRSGRDSNDPEIMNMPLESPWGVQPQLLGRSDVVCGPTSWVESERQLRRGRL